MLFKLKLCFLHKLTEKDRNLKRSDGKAIAEHKRKRAFYIKMISKISNFRYNAYLMIFKNTEKSLYFIEYKVFRCQIIILFIIHDPQSVQI